jgi:ATP-dependent exoDNAse (exonuclease V) beta subunit
MKSRIIGELAKLAKNEESKYVAILKNELGIEKDVIIIRAEKVLTSILHDYYHFSVKTIESFFQNIIQSFLKEIGLHQNIRIELNTKKVLDNAVAKFIAEIAENSSVISWLTDFVNYKLQEEKSWNISKDITKLGYEIFKEEFLSFSQQFQESISNKKGVREYVQQMHANIKNFENGLVEIAETALSIIQENDLTVNDFFQKNKGPAGYFHKIKNRDFSEPGTYAKNAAEDPEKWSTKKSEKFVQITQLAESQLQGLMQKIVRFYQTEIINYQSAKSILENIHTLVVLADISKKVREYAEENSLFLLSDGTKLLNDIINYNDTPFIYEKTGLWYKHFMIDEFQDTSTMQWKNFKPLIENSLSENNLGLLVGDVKQSIYRWRNGDWQLLAEKLQEDIVQFGIDQTLVLNTNWRSQKNIVDFNNEFFNQAPKILKDQYEKDIDGHYGYDEIKDFASKFNHAYADIEQKSAIATSKESGFIHARFYSNINKNDWQIETLNDLLKTILDLTKQHSYRFNDLVVLVRKKEEAKIIANYLHQYNNTNQETGFIPFISDEALYISSSIVIQFIICLFKYFNNPDDDINKQKIVSDYNRYIVLEIEEIPREFAFDEIINILAPEQSDLIDLQKLALYDLAETIIKKYKLNRPGGQSAYLLAFLDMILEFTKSNFADRNAFIEWWDEEGIEKTLHFPDDQDAIRIMTIHKAKGLEFNVVLLPFCDWHVDHLGVHAPILWCQPESEPFNNVPVVPIKYKKDLAQSVFYKDYFNEKMLIAIDNLNLLYVAFTRAKNALFLNGMIGKKQDAITTVADLAITCLKDFSALRLKENISTKNDLEITEYSLGEIPNKKSVETPGKDDRSLIIKQMPTQKTGKKIRIRETYKKEIDDIQDIIKSPVSYGKLMHRLFENIKSIQDIDYTIDTAVSEGWVTNTDADQLKAYVKQRLENEQVKEWFAKKWKVMNETTILMPNGKQYRPDRVMIGDKETIVIDYKFTALHEEHHRKQVMNYKKHLQIMGYEKVNGFLWYVPENSIVEV